MGDLDPHLIHGSLGPPKSSTQTAYRSVESFLQGSLVWQTDHTTRSITIGCIYLCSSAVGPNYNNNSIKWSCCHHCKSSPGSFDVCRLSARWPPTLKPSELSWPMSLLTGCYRPCPPLPFIIITQPKSWCFFTMLWWVEGWVNLGAAVWVCILCLWCISQWLSW